MCIDNMDCLTGCEKMKTKESGFSAEVLFKQLGGGRFVAMTGAKHFVKDCAAGCLSFKIPKAKNKINYVKISLNPRDLYDMEFGKIERRAGEIKYKVIETVTEVYNDTLQAIFTEKTGLYTHL